MRKMMLGFMAAAMVCSMAACGSKQETAAPAGTPAQTQSEAQKQEKCRGQPGGNHMVACNERRQ